MTLALALALAAALQAPPAAQRPDSLLVEVAGRVTVLREADLARLPQDSQPATFHGQTHVYAGPRITEVLRVAGVALDSLHGPTLTTRVVVEASDGYRVVYSLPELLPGFNGRRVLVAFRMDGGALPANERPFRLVAPEDGAEHSRWIRAVTAIRLRRE